ncbi:MAG: ABC transporter ATP-binding protein [Rickettsiales bacterium]|nr:MAG: ABC transporter ATP-binding protein [Rickettsiales bacterium]
MTEVLRLDGVNKTYKDGCEVIDNSFLTINEGESVAFVGPSGIGKTTFLQICGLLDTPTKGNIYINNKNVALLNDNEKTSIRKNDIGFVFQFHHLLPEFSVLENVLIAPMIDKKDLKDKAIDILTDLGLETKINNRPNELSGGERQRVAIARAIIKQPKIILADEPTGNLDKENADNVFDLLLQEVQKYNTALLMVTHNYELATRLEKIITIENKQIKPY